MRKLFKVGSFIAVLMLVLAGCGQQPIYNVPKESVVLKNGTSNADVYKAIKTAGMSKGWVISKVSDNLAQGTLNLRKHKAVVSIAYDETGFSIMYKSSVNLASDGKLIHSNYNGWIKNLKQAITVQLSGLAE